jgi:hypothetical protein
MPYPIGVIGELKFFPFFPIFQQVGKIPDEICISSGKNLIIR